nr:AIF_HP1_G0030660.mRNA.1.CDS.1 [Saccharomyces cerevisiae]
MIENVVNLAASVDYPSIHSAQCFVLELTTFDMNRPLLPGTPFILFIGVKEQPARIKRLISFIDKGNTNDNAFVGIEPSSLGEEEDKEAMDSFTNCLAVKMITL